MNNSTLSLPPVRAQILKPRAGLGNFLQKLQTQPSVAVAYFGGSITEAAGWRCKTLEWLRREYPATEFHEIYAAIGGTGSDLGVYRLDRDVLKRKPDLMFVEFAVNDGSAPPHEILRSMEGIVRQAWAADPSLDICFIYTLHTDFVPALEEGLCPQSAAADELVADHYGVPSINVALEIVRQARAGRVVYQAGDPPRADVVEFSRDQCHPTDAGHEIYSQVIADAFHCLKDIKPQGPHALGEPLVPDHLQRASMHAVPPAALAGSWRKLGPDEPLAKQFSCRLDEIWEATAPGDSIEFRFRGTEVSLYDILGPDAAQVMATVDGAPIGPISRFDKFCHYYRVGTFCVASHLAETIHTVRITVDSVEPDRTPAIAEEKEDFPAEKYRGTALRAAALLIDGEIVGAA